MASFWNFITDFGDTAVTLPLAGLTIAFLFLSGWRRAALLFALTLAGCGIAIGLTKLFLQSCGQPLLHVAVTNPSGHAAMSTAVYGSLAILYTAREAAERRWLPWIGAGLLLGAIALSRVILDTHSPIEVALGLAIGLAALALFRRGLADEPAVPFEGFWFAITAAVLIAIMHGTRWPVEDIVRSIAHLIRNSVPSCH